METIPGTSENGDIDVVQLKDWVYETRKLCEASDMQSLCDHYMGQMLAHAPVDSDGTWPPLAMRELIEDIASPELESEIAIGVFNKRGVTTRSFGDGGQQERDLANLYKEYSAKVIYSFPRTASMLNQIAEYYVREGRRFDIDDELHET